MRARHTVVFIVIVITVLTLGLTIITVNRNMGLVGVYFYPWYSSDGRHWNASADPTWAVVEKPVIGFYDSRDEHVIRWQLKLIRDAGIDFIIISWWGPGSYEDNATKAIVRYLRESNLRFAILIEPYLGNDPTLYDRGFWDNTLRYVRANFIEPYRDVYMYLHGKPLILAFNPIGLSYRPHDNFPDYTIRITGNDIDNAKYQDWDYWPDYLLSSPSLELRIRRDNMVSIVPRFCDEHFRTPGTCMDPDLSQLLYRKQWKWVLGNADRVNIVMITSWNEYHERTQIEPSYSNETHDPWLLYNMTKEYITLYRARYSSSSLAFTLTAYILVVIIVGSVVKLVSKLI